MDINNTRIKRKIPPEKDDDYNRNLEYNDGLRLKF